MPTIDHALQRFLELERERRPDEMEGTELAIDNLRSFLDGYGYQYVDDDPDDFDDYDDEDEDDYEEDQEDFAAAHDAGMLPAAMAEFLYSWNIRKFMGGTADDARATGVAIARLMELLAEEDWADRDEATKATELSHTAAEELPRAKRLSDLLFGVAQATPPAKAEELEDDVDDFITIARIEPGRLWFSEDVGPIDVPEEASGLAQVGWWVNLAAQRRAGTWFITETGSVYPRMIEDDEDEGDAAWSDLPPGTPSLD